MKTRKSAESLKDPRSQGRKRARAALEKEGRPKICENCGKPEPKPPKGLSKEELVNWKRANVLEVQHINKNILDNDPANLKYLCDLCHKREDMQTKKGESLIEDEFGYGLEFF